MRSLIISFLLAATAAATSRSLPHPDYIFKNPSASEVATYGFKIPTVQESAVMARRMFRYEDIGVLSTQFPEQQKTLENRPADVAGLPFGIMEYFADCEPQSGNPTILAVDIASTYRNVAAGSNISLTMRWHAPHPELTWMTPAALPRFTLMGTLESMSKKEIEEGKIASCFGKYHKDAKIWMPGNDIHESHWTRLVVKEVYWFGGFGDRSYIGWIPVDVWKNVTDAEIEKIRLPGELPIVERIWGSMQRFMKSEM